MKPWLKIKVLQLESEVHSEPLASYAVGKSRVNNNGPVLFVSLPPTDRIISSTEKLRGFKSTLVVRDEKYNSMLLLIGNGDIAATREAMQSILEIRF